MLKLKHWQLFLLVGLLISCISYPSFLVSDYFFNLHRSFADSTFPALATTLFYALWFDSMIKLNGNQNGYRLFAAIIFLGLLVLAFFIEQGEPSPHVALTILLTACAIGWLVFVVYPTAKILQSKENRPDSVDARFLIDLLAIAAFFPFGLWYIQPRVNKLGIT